MAQAIIMAGGQGERFWPLTHGQFPKYRIRFDGKASLLQKTYQRLSKVYDQKKIHVITTREHVPLVKAELPRLKNSNILIEPFRHNTACAILFSCLSLVLSFGKEEVTSFFPADHLIENEIDFKKTMRDAIHVAEKSRRLVVIGIQPTFPATGFGYIECGPKIKRSDPCYPVRRFKEKPTRAVASRYLKQGRFLWNAGIVTWRIGVFLEAMQKFALKAYRRFDIRNPAQSYKRLPNLSIDYALLEKADNLVVMKTKMGWCDLGSWDMFLEKASKDRNQNFVYGKTFHPETTRSLLVNHHSTPLVVLGARELVVVQTSQGTLICDRRRSEEAALILRKVFDANSRN